ncbi:hypothetical protein I6J42_34720 (plasmid) [Streptomyces californicus]|uniref:Uncharacterized protein n=1 Tax=Streptomyces californicus TaxID=67351 RepID=A0ABD7D6S4_9ACTN|nr:hypothetical protein [Streptomyces californicus]QRV39222.1 hypothetical protein I6J42_34720 [Streptomyces californicus]QRV52674.1 hypothetical protein I6J43_34740 [Streptomyces californicus]
MTTRRVLGAGPQTPAPSSIRAAAADILKALPGIRLPDLHELRDRGVVGSHLPRALGARRTLGVGPLAEEDAETSD